MVDVPETSSSPRRGLHLLGIVGSLLSALVLGGLGHWGWAAGALLVCAVLLQPWLRSLADEVLEGYVRFPEFYEARDFERAEACLRRAEARSRGGSVLRALRLADLARWGSFRGDDTLVDQALAGFEELDDDRHGVSHADAAESTVVARKVASLVQARKHAERNGLKEALSLAVPAFEAFDKGYVDSIVDRALGEPQSSSLDRVIHLTGVPSELAIVAARAGKHEWNERFIPVALRTVGAAKNQVLMSSVVPTLGRDELLFLWSYTCHTLRYEAHFVEEAKAKVSAEFVSRCVWIRRWPEVQAFARAMGTGRAARVTEANRSGRPDWY